MEPETNPWKVTVYDPAHLGNEEHAALLAQFKQLRKKVMDDPRRRGTWNDSPLERPGDQIASFALATHTDGNGQEKVLSGVRFIMASDYYDHIKEILRPGTYDVLAAVCPEVKNRELKIAKIDLPASDIMPADISPIGVAYSLYDKVIAWAKERGVDMIICAPIPDHARLIERYCKTRGLPLQKLGDCMDTNLEGASKPKVVCGMALTDKVHFKLPIESMSV